VWLFELTTKIHPQKSTSMTRAQDNNWMVLYTRSRWEKKADQSLKDKNVVSYCPLVKTSKQWVDRNKTVEILYLNLIYSSTQIQT
jgi:hypothetical protein